MTIKNQITIHLVFIAAILSLSQTVVHANPDTNQPFFAYLSTNAPHGPFIAPPEYQQKFKDLGFGSKPAGFYGMIEHIDFRMGQMFAKLEAWGLMENTIIIFTSDNGMTRIGCGLNGFAGRPQVKLGLDKTGSPMMSYNAGMKGLKGTVDEGGVRVPFFVQWNGSGQHGRTEKTVASYLDILPTIAELAGAKLPENHLFEGRSLKPLLLGKSPEWEDRFLFQHVTRWKLGAEPDQFKWKSYSVRNQRFRLVEGVLYDMENDPSQTKDVTAEHPELVAEMQKRYGAFWDEVRPLMINDGVPLAEKKPFHVDYNAQKKEQGIPDWIPPKL